MKTMKKLFTTLFVTLFLSMISSFVYSQCNIQASICAPGTAGPFNFVPTGGAYAGGAYLPGSCATGSGGLGNDFAFIILNITSTGPLNILIDGNTAGGFLDVIAFNIPPGLDPCIAIQNPVNEIACNFAGAAGGCVQIGTAFPCTSTIPAPVVVAGQQIMIIVHDWSDVNTTFTLDLGPLPGAQTGPPDPTIINDGPFCESSIPIQLLGVSAGGTWTGTGVSVGGIFSPSLVGPGIYTITYDVGLAPCDAQSNTQIEVLPEYNIIENVSVCNGNYTFPDGTIQNITSNTTHISNLNTITGCDSIITTNVTIVPAVTSTQNISVCNGVTVTFPDASTQVIIGPVTQVSTLVGGSIAGCDSIITTNVTLLPNSTSTINVSVCSGDSYTFPDASVNTSVTVPVTQVSTLVGSGANGCDSIVTTNVSVDPIYNLVNNVSICEGDNYTFPDGSTQVGIVVPVTQVSNLTTTLGCDSIITTNISIDPIYNLTENVSVCDGDSYTYPDGTVQSAITTPVTYISNLTTTIGCDSIITTNVSVDPIFNLVQNVSVCSGSDYTFPDGFIQVGIVAPVSHTSNLTTTLGCDSIITTSLGVFASFTSTSNFDICTGTDFTFADGSIQTNLTTPTTYVSTLLSIDGCDSLVTENISINPVYNLVENFDQCPGNGFTFPDGTVMSNINNNTTYVSNLVTSNGCDSIITTNVNIYNVPPMDITFTSDGCPLLDMTMTNNAAGIDCNWNVSGPGTSQNYTGCGSISDTYFNSGFYDVTLTMTSVDGCPMDTTITNAFQVYPEPLAQFTWDPNEGNIITNNTINFINTSIGGTYYNWSFGDNTYSSGSGELHTYQDTGHFQVQLVVTNGFGCTDTANGLVIIHEEFFIYVPNSFTPDGDAHNNTFKPIVSGHDEQSYTLYIFDRWGEILFESHNSEVGWDGTYNGTMSQDGVYVWKVSVKTNRNLRKEFVGHVTLLR